MVCYRNKQQTSKTKYWLIGLDIISYSWPPSANKWIKKQASDCCGVDTLFHTLREKDIPCFRSYLDWQRVNFRNGLRRANWSEAEAKRGDKKTQQTTSHSRAEESRIFFSSLLLLMIRMERIYHTEKSELSFKALEIRGCDLQYVRTWLAPPPARSETSQCICLQFQNVFVSNCICFK